MYLFISFISVLVILCLAFLMIRKSRFSKPFLVIIAMMGVGFLLYMFNPVKMGLVGLSSYGFPGPFWKSAERTDDWTVNNKESGRISLSSQTINSDEDADINATISFMIDTTKVRPVVNINVKKFRGLGDDNKYPISFMEGGKSLTVKAEYMEMDVPKYDEATEEAIEYFNGIRSFWDLSERAMLRAAEIKVYVDNNRLDLYGKDALKIIRKFRKAKDDVTMTLVGDGGETATFIFDITGFKEAYGTFFRFVKSYEEDNHPEAEIPIFQEICRKLGFYF